jgi:hypothetical protein
MKILGAAALVLLSGLVSVAQRTIPDQDPSDVLRRMPLVPNAVEDRLEERAVQALDRIHHATSRREVEASVPLLRQNLTDSLGYRRLPWPPELKSTVTGIVQRNGYHIEKIVLQSLPNVLVPGLLYVPDKLSSQAPAVLLAGGQRWKYGKSDPDSQIFAINMTLLGFVVLSSDAIGEGERGASDQDHHHPEALPVGLSQPGIVEYETQCELEYLRSRREIDARRIGITGVDGGGFNTWISMAVDERIAAGAPLDDTLDFRDLIRRMRGVNWDGARDQCRLIPGILQYANIHELIALAAPRPVLMIGDSDDSQILDYAHLIYGTFANSEGIRHFESEGSGYLGPRRRAAYGFFLQALMKRGDGAPIEEPTTEIMPPGSTETQCLPSGAQAPAGPGISNAIRQLATAALSESPSMLPEQLGGLRPANAYRAIGIHAGRPVERINQATEAGISVPLTLLRPGPGHSGNDIGTLLVVDDRDKELFDSDPIVQEALRRNYMIVGMDPRGFGELASQKPGWIFATSVLLGENFVWKQAWDLRSMLDEFQDLSAQKKTLAVYARGPNASLAAAYAIRLSGAELEWAVLRDCFTSVREFVNRPAELQPPRSRQSIPYDYFAFNAFRAWDLPEIFSASKTKVFIIDPLDTVPPRALKSDRVRLTDVELFVNTDWDKYLQ